VGGGWLMKHPLFGSDVAPTGLNLPFAGKCQMLAAVTSDRCN
jgi:hypothetical protein